MWFSCTERENLAGDGKGKGASGYHREAFLGCGNPAQAKCGNCPPPAPIMLERAQRECGHYGNDAVFVREEPAYSYMENAVILDVEATPTRISREVDAT